MIEMNDSIPLYIQIQELIKSNIEQGVYPHGAKIPTEQELIQLYGVSRITIRKAITELVNENTLIKQQGKGTFVSQQKVERQINQVQALSKEVKSLSQLLTEQGYVVSSKILLCETILVTSDIHSALEIGAGEKVIHIARIRYADKQAFSMEHVYFPYKTCSFLLEQYLSGSIYSILNTHGIFPKNILQFSIEAVTAGVKRSKLLDTSVHAPLLFQKVLVGDKDNHPINYSYQYFIGSCYKFNVI